MSRSRVTLARTDTGAMEREVVPQLEMRQIGVKKCAIST